MAIPKTYSFDYLKTFIFPQQSERELNFIWEILDEVKPKKILEIGTGAGALTAMLSVHGPKTKVVTVDQIPNKVPNYQHLVNLGKIRKEDLNIHYIIGDSHDKKIRDKVKDNYDLVIIDADHSKEGGQLDWEWYAPMGEVIGLHDIVGYENPDPNENWFPRLFWKQVREHDLKTKEFVDVPSGGWGFLFNE